ncbi:MAG TPA: hypothetical protein VK791_09235 [bacterium]|jgi:hypothetical protein|nr:hypothetical protein [bacterium]
MFKNGLNHFKTKSTFWIFGCFYLLFTLFTFRDYGITDDEYDCYIGGAYHLKHYYHHTTLDEYNLFTDDKATHNYIYPALLHILTLLNAEKLHLFNMLLALFIYWAAYQVLQAAYEKPWWALLGPFFIFITFRFSGDVPANPKDAPFAIFYFFTLAMIYLSREKNKNPLGESLFLGSLIGWTTAIRAIGLTVFPLLIFYRFYEAISESKAQRQKLDVKAWFSREWRGFLAAFIISQFWLMALWPYLGSNYFGNLPNIFLLAKSFPWGGPILFMGQRISTLNLPWTYLPLYLLITLPLFILLFFFISLIFFKPKAQTKEAKLYVLFASALILNILMYLVLKPVIYNALRHYLFLVPLICVMGTMGLIEFFTTNKFRAAKGILAGFIILNIFLVLLELFHLYPYQYAYFNELVGGFKGATGRFEQDYWSASDREAVLWLRNNEATDLNKTYRVKISGTPWQSLYYFGPNMQGDPNMRNPDYEITQELPANIGNTKPSIQLLHTVEREGVPLCYVLKYKH